jgi:hypothetical protein
VESQLFGRTDEEHLLYAVGRGLILVTKDPDDFEALHRRHPGHPGILAVYQDNLPSDMTARDIVHAIQNLIDANAPIENVFQALNGWNW